MMLDADDRAALRAVAGIGVVVCAGLPTLALLLGASFRLFRMVAGI